MIAIRYPELVGRVLTYAATFGPDVVKVKRSHQEGDYVKMSFVHH